MLGSTRRAETGLAAGVKAGRLFLRAAGSVGDALRWPEIEINSATDCQPRRGPKTGFDQSRKMARIVVMWVDRVGRLWDHQIVE